MVEAFPEFQNIKEKQNDKVEWQWINGQLKYREQHGGTGNHNGGDINIIGGDGGVLYSGGNVNITGGSASFDGDIILTPGDGSGSIEIKEMSTR